MLLPLCFAIVQCVVAVLSGERLSQMTKTYDDVAAITLLLEEVDRYRIMLITVGVINYSYL